MPGLLLAALHPRRLLALLAGAAAGALYLWIAAVRAVPSVRRRKTARRRRLLAARAAAREAERRGGE
ncbi:MAG TPA: hypothetical protein VNJ53_09170 [Gaiellaceae bacterium]|nr:hypothetical protein [Gaiellaceae bacterium]